MEGKQNEVSKPFHQAEAHFDDHADEQHGSIPLVRQLSDLRSHFISALADAGSDDTGGDHRVQQRCRYCV
jgi:hypothetical protein